MPSQYQAFLFYFIFLHIWNLLYIYLLYIYEFGIYKIKNIQASLQSISKITNVLKIDMMILLQSEDDDDEEALACWEDHAEIWAIQELLCKCSRRIQ